MRWAALALALAACGPDCYLEVVDGTDDNRAGVVQPDDRITFRAHVGERTFTCGGTWLVNGFVGGSPELGTIDECGVYTAPASYPPGLVAVNIEAIFPGHAGCEALYLSFVPPL